MAISGEMNSDPFLENRRFRSLVRKRKKREIASHLYSGATQVPPWRIAAHLEGESLNETTQHPTPLQPESLLSEKRGGK